MWRTIEQLGSAEQKRTLQWQLQAREPIHSFVDMTAGDHLVIQRSKMGGLISYEHHFLCIGYNDRCPKIVFYCMNTFSIRRITLPDKDFLWDETELQAEGRKVARVVWPEGLRRYSVAEAVERALTRLGEKQYNNFVEASEMFVMWCLCGLPINLRTYNLYEKSLLRFLTPFYRGVGVADEFFHLDLFIYVI